MGCFDSGGGGASSKFEYNDDVKPYMQWILPAYQDAVTQNWNGPPQYTGQRIAGLNTDQTVPMDEIRALNYGVSDPTGTINDAMAQTQGTLQGQYLNGPGQNPFSRNNPFASQKNQYVGQMNPWSDAGNGYIGQTNAYANQGNEYAGENPYYNQVKQRGMQDIAQNYRDAIAPDLKGQMVLNGTLGGGAEDQLRSKNEMALSKSLSDYGMGMDNQQYDRSANLRAGDLTRMGGLTQSDLERNTSANATDLARHQQGWDSDLSRNMTGQESDLSRMGGLYDSFLNRGSQNYEGERGRMMGAIDQGNQQQGLALGRAGALSTVGDYQRGLTQQGLDQNYQDFLTNRDWRQNQLGWLGGQFSQAMGGMATPNQTTTPAANNWANGLGGALAAYGMFRA